MKNRQTVLITGCSSGFGYLAVLKFARRGFWTFASFRSLESQGAQDLGRIKNQENLPLELIPIDVRSDQSVLAGVQMVLAKTGRIDVLVNNAGFGYSGPVELFEIDEIKDQYETNVFGVLRMIKAVTPSMRRQKSGTIINLSSIAGLMTTPLNGIYASSKYSLEALSEALRFELKPFGLNVCLVEPGSFLTNFWQNLKYAQASKEPDSVYGGLTEGFYKRQSQLKRQLNQGWLARFFSPNRVVDKILEIAQNPNPGLRYRVGLDTNFYLVRRLLPQRLWEWLLRRAYGW